MAPLDSQTAPFSLPALPYPEDALEPTISARTLSFHHGKHHKAYVEKTNELLKGSPLAGRSLEEVVRGAKDNQELFNNAAQAWNHDFYWHCLAPRSSKPGASLQKAIDTAFGDLDTLKEKLVKAAVGQFGSGWAWLIVKKGALEIVTTGNADTPIAHEQTPLLTIDVWEHAYYLDYQNQREAHVKAVLDKLANWDFASENFEHAKG